MLFQNSNEHGEAVGVEAGGFSFGAADESGGGEGLEFDEDAAGAVHGGADDGARAVFV